MKARGFTLIEMLLTLSLLAAMMVLIYTSLNLGIRAWNTGDARVTESSHLRIVQGFLRRELSQVFPIRWRGIPDSKIAFEGAKDEIKFVTSLNLDAGLHDGGLQWARLAVGEDKESSGQALYLTREPFDIQAKDFSSLGNDKDKAKPVRLVGGLSGAEISYFGSDNDINDPAWTNEWTSPLRLPRLIKIHFETSREARPLPDLVIALQLGEEAGCYDTNFQRQCGPRRA